MSDSIWNRYPATRWFDGTPLGNGVIGALIYGSLYKETVVFNHEQLYTPARTQALPDISGHLPAVRKLMEEGRYREANYYYAKLLKELGYHPDVGNFIPALDLRIVQPVADEFGDYSRVLNMEEGICDVNWTVSGRKYGRRSWVSASDGVFAMQFLAEDGLENVKLGLQLHDPMDSRNQKGELLPPCVETSVRVVDGCYLYFSGKIKDGMSYGAVLKAQCSRVRPGNDTHVSTAAGMTSDEHLLYPYLLCGGETITVLVDVFVGCGETEFAGSRAKLDSLATETMEQTHRQAFSAMYNACRFDVEKKPDAGKCMEQILLDGYDRHTDFSNIVKLGKLGRYLFISSAMHCAMPANLLGLWNGAYMPMWHGVFFNDENLEMNYWQAMQGNLCDSMLPVFDLFDRFKEDYRENARKLFGCKGMLVPLFLDNQSGLKKCLAPHVLYWTGSNGWIGSLYFDYYRYTGDEKFLTERAYPFLKESFDFYEDFARRKADGKLWFYPTTSPENCPLGDFEDAGNLRLGINATMDYAVCRELARNLLYIEENFLHHGDVQQRVKTFLDRLPGYTLNEDGAVREWNCPGLEDNYNHRHVSHIYPVFPGIEVTEEKDPVLFHGFETALDKRMEYGLRAQTGWSLAHIANAFVRVHQGEKALRCIQDIFRFCLRPNGFTLHNDWRNMGCTLRNLAGGGDPIVDLDTNFGITSALLEMLVFSDDTRIKLFPARPGVWSTGSFSGILTRGGYKLCAQWDEKGGKAEIYACRDGAHTIDITGFYFADGTREKTVYFRAGESVKLAFVRRT